MTVLIMYVFFHMLADTIKPEQNILYSAESEQKVMYKGIFWVFVSMNGVEQHYNLVPVKALCDSEGNSDAAAVYSSKSGKNFNHKKEWEKLSRTVPGCRNKPFDYLPRGRVEIDSGKVRVFANPLIIENESLHRLIIDEFDLYQLEDRIKWIADNSNHYRYLLDDIDVQEEHSIGKWNTKSQKKITALDLRFFSDIDRMEGEQPHMNFRDKVRNYKLRHLNIGRVKNLDKKRFDVFCIERVSWDVHWQTNLYLAVIIRDYLRLFIKNTLAIGNCVIEDHNAVKYGLDDEQNAYYSKKWEERVNMVADEFDELIKMMLIDSSEIQDYLEFDNTEKAIKQKAFSDLAEIFDDLCW